MITSLRISPAEYSSLTMELWVKPLTQNPKVSSVMHGDDGGWDRSMAYISGQWEITKGDQAWFPGAAASLGQWQHIVTVWTPEQITFYHNGVKYEYGSGGNFGSSNQPLTFGKNDACAGCNADVIIDEAVVYSHALSDAEVSHRYHYHNLFVPELIDVSSPTYERRPELKWNSVDSATDYTLKIDTTTSFSSPLVQLSVSDTAFTPLSDLPYGWIYWQVKADNTALSSKIGSFYLQDSLTPIPIPCDPDPTKERRPVFSWHEVAGASNYTLAIDTSALFTRPLVTLTVSDTTFTPLSDLPTGTVYWKVKSDLADSYSFVEQVIIQADTVPFLYRYNGSRLDTVRPLFEWEPVASAATYKIQLDTLSDFSSPIVSLDVADTAFSPLSDLVQGLTYYWRVSCDLDFSVFSPVDSLVIDTHHTTIQARLAAEDYPLKVSPNPFNPEARIRFENPDRNANISIFSVNGKRVAQFENIESKQVIWNAIDKSCGVYLVRLSLGNKTYQKKIILVK
jgi:hypothetical protein